MIGVEALLWEWAAKMAMLGLAIAAVAVVYFVGRAHGRQAQRRATVRTVVEDLIAETVVIPQQRSEVDS